MDMSWLEKTGGIHLPGKSDSQSVRVVKWVWWIRLGTLIRTNLTEKTRIQKCFVFFFFYDVQCFLSFCVFRLPVDVGQPHMLAASQDWWGGRGQLSWNILRLYEWRRLRSVTDDSSVTVTISNEPCLIWGCSLKYSSVQMWLHFSRIQTITQSDL